MGDMADFALDQISDMDEIYVRHQNDPPAERFEAGLNDERGYELPAPFHGTARGPGPCPVCGAPTRKLTNKKLQIPFYGCTRYPACKGSLDA